MAAATSSPNGFQFTNLTIPCFREQTKSIDVQAFENRLFVQISQSDWRGVELLLSQNPIWRDNVFVFENCIARMLGKAAEIKLKNQGTTIREDDSINATLFSAVTAIGILKKNGIDVSYFHFLELAFHCRQNFQRAIEFAKSSLKQNAGEIYFKLVEKIQSAPQNSVTQAFFADLPEFYRRVAVQFPQECGEFSRALQCEMNKNNSMEFKYYWSHTTSPLSHPSNISSERSSHQDKKRRSNMHYD